MCGTFRDLVGGDEESDYWHSSQGEEVVSHIKGRWLSYRRLVFGGGMCSVFWE